MFGIGNPKGEVRVCPKCKRFHDILRGTMCYCACGQAIESKVYAQRKNQE